MPSTSFYEVSVQQRREGEIFKQVLIPDTGAVPTDAACLLGKRRFMFELNQRTNEQDVKPGEWHNQAAIITEMLEECYECDSWYPYVPGRSPAEHQDDLQTELLEENRRVFELNLFKINQQLQLDSKQLLVDSKELTRTATISAGNFEKYQKRITWLFILLAIIGVMTGFIQIWQGDKGTVIEGAVITIDATSTPTPTPTPPTLTPDLPE